MYIVLLFALLSAGQITMRDMVQGVNTPSLRNQVGVACMAPGGVVNEEGRCVCYGGWSGPACATRNKCFEVNCENGGSCNPETGLCQCPETHTGLHCEVSSCSHNGYWDPRYDHCSCKMGFAGTHCEQCATTIPSSTGQSYVCVPSKSSGGYILMRLPTGFGEKIISGEIKPESSLSYTGIRPGSTGYDGRHYGCDCQPEKSREARVTNAALNLYTAIITECIETSTLNAQQMAEMQGFWYECVSLEEQGLLTNTYFILFVVFLVLFIALLAGLVIYCIVINYNKQQQQQEENEPEEDVEYGSFIRRVPRNATSKKIQGYYTKLRK